MGAHGALGPSSPSLLSAGFVHLRLSLGKPHNEHSQLFKKDEIEWNGDRMGWGGVGWGGEV